MKIGQTIDFIRDNENPVKSKNTRTIAAALSCGCKFAERSFLDTVEQTDNGPKRTVTWNIDGDTKAVFRPNFKEEELTFTEVRKRYEDLEWCTANPDHPISYLRAFNDNLNRLTDFVKQSKPLALIRRGNRMVLIPQDCSQSKKEKFLAML